MDTREAPPNSDIEAMPADLEKNSQRIADLEIATVQEHDLGFLQAVKLYPKAIWWSIVMSTALIMEGYDTALLKSLFALPSFLKAYGGNISAPWQAGLTNGSSVGQLFGLLIAGQLSERVGPRMTMIGGLALATAIIFIEFFAPSLAVLEVGQILLGIPLGITQMIPVVYALEISPMSLQPYLTTYVNLSWHNGKILGHLLELGVLRGVLNLEHSRWAYRIPFAIQWFWPLVLIPTIFFAPESPWWLVRRGRHEEAKAVFKSLTTEQNTHFDVDKHLALVIATTEHERQVNLQTSYMACFTGTNLRRTIILVTCYCIQLLSGNTLRGYSTYFFEQAGMATEQAFNMSIGGVALSILGMILAWFLLPHFGRRSIYLGGLLGLLAIWITVGALGVPHPKSGLTRAIGALLLISSFVYDFTIGPVVYAFISEVPSSLLRSKSASIARLVYSVISIVSNIITPYQLNNTAWNWGAKAAFFWAGATLLGLVFTFFCIPETKDRTTAELDILFEKKVPSRQFARTPVDISDAAPGYTIQSV
ncbi:hypothetical protein B7463_g11071, partial [Scytalidium lignicola]